MVLTAEQLAVATGALVTRAAAVAGAYNAALPLYKITTRLRMACFFANVGHECGGFQYKEEIWGPTPAQVRYEGRLDLGNTQPGDGERYKGHGHIQVTGRANHVMITRALRARFPGLSVPDFEADPEQLCEPQWAALSACEYVAQRKLNDFADVAAFDSYCDIVNRGRVTAALGDTNGFPQRLALFVAGMRYLP